jgi:hypothetical protein
VRRAFGHSERKLSDTITHCRRARLGRRASKLQVLPCNREFRAKYECRVDLCLNPLIVKLIITKLVSNRYIQRRAANHHGRIVTIGQLVLFSTETGDAWLLDPADRLAARLARDGDSEPIHIEDTDTTFAIGWKGRYRIEGAAFVYWDNDSGRVTTILGYPTDQLAEIG